MTCSVVTDSLQSPNAASSLARRHPHLLQQSDRHERDRQYGHYVAQTYTFYSGLGTHHQDRGYGTLLMRQGQRLALFDTRNIPKPLPLLLKPTPVARRLFEQQGFYVLWEGKICGVQDASMVWYPDLSRLWIER
jgi:hypothetical protein